MPSLHRVTAFILIACAALLNACSPKVQIDIGAGPERLAEGRVLRDEHAGKDKVAMIEVRGMLFDGNRPELLGTGVNPVDRFIAQLDMAERDPNTRAIIIRITSPGGTVTSSDIMHSELRRFSSKTGKPVIASMGEVAASGGYYLAIGCDHIIAHPTTITGSIGVIIPTLNFSDGLARLGIHARSIKSGANKDMANPLEPMREHQYEVLQGMVDEFYGNFKALVIKRRPALKVENLANATDGRVFTGSQALALGLVDELGGVREAFDAAKKRAGLSAATLVKYTDERSPPRSAYSAADQPPAQMNTTSINLLQLNLADPLGHMGLESSGIYYLWTPAAN